MSSWSLTPHECQLSYHSSSHEPNWRPLMRMCFHPIHSNWYQPLINVQWVQSVTDHQPFDFHWTVSVIQVCVICDSWIETYPQPLFRRVKKVCYSIQDQLDPLETVGDKTRINLKLSVWIQETWFEIYIGVTLLRLLTKINPLFLLIYSRVRTKHCWSAWDWEHTTKIISNQPISPLRKAGMTFIISWIGIEGSWLGSQSQ